MTILELIKAQCKSLGIPVKYADHILKTYNVEKEEQVQAAVENFNTNTFPIIKENQTTAQTAITEYEKKHGLKDGKPIQTPKGKNGEQVEDENAEDDDYGDLPPAFRKFMMANQKQIETLTKGFEKLTQTIDDSGKKKRQKSCLTMPNFRKNGSSVLMSIQKYLLKIKSKNSRKNTRRFGRGPCRKKWNPAIIVRMWLNRKTERKKNGWKS